MNPNQDRHRNLYEDPLSVLLWWYDLAIFLMLFPSNSIIVFLRKNLGYRLMRPWVFLIVYLPLLFTAFTGFAALSIGNSPSGYNQTYRPNAYGQPSFGQPAPPAPEPESPSRVPYVMLGLFAVSGEALALYHRRKGWRLAFRNPDPVHSMSRGDSYLTLFLNWLSSKEFKVPAKEQEGQSQPARAYHFPVVPEWIVQRYIEPALVGLLGIFLMFAVKWWFLGYWLLISGAFLAGIEALVLEKAINTMLDIRDDRIEGGFLKAMDDAASGKGQPPASNAKVGGLVTTSPELARLRAQRLAADPDAPPKYE